MDVSADGRWIYVSSRWARKLSVVDTQAGKVVRQVVDADRKLSHFLV